MAVAFGVADDMRELDTALATHASSGGGTHASPRPTRTRLDARLFVRRLRVRGHLCVPNTPSARTSRRCDAARIDLAWLVMASIRTTAIVVGVLLSLL